MQQNNEEHWNHKIGAVILAVLLTTFLVYAQYMRGRRGLAGLGVRPAAPRPTGYQN